MQGSGRARPNMRISQGCWMGRQDKQAQGSSSVGGKSRRLDAAKGSERWKSGREVMDGLCHWMRGKVISKVAGRGRMVGRSRLHSFRDITTDAHFSYCSTCLLKHFSFFAKQWSLLSFPS